MIHDQPRDHATGQEYYKHPDSEGEYTWRDAVQQLEKYINTIWMDWFNSPSN